MPDSCRTTVQLAGAAFHHGRIVTCQRKVHGRKRGLRWPEFGPVSNAGYFLGAFVGAGIGGAGFGFVGLLLAFPLMAIGAVLGDLADQGAGWHDRTHAGTIPGWLDDGRDTNVEVKWNS